MHFCGFIHVYLDVHITLCVMFGTCKLCGLYNYMQYVHTLACAVIEWYTGSCITKFM